MKLKYCLPAMLLLLLQGRLHAQTTDENIISPLYVDGNLPNLTIKKVINYKTDSFHITDFKNKLLIFNFWGTYCSACINRFEDEQQLQQQFANDVQFILVTDEPAEKVKKTIQRWEQRHNEKFIFPLVVEDTILNKYIRSSYRPHFAWIDYWQRLVAQTNEYYINANCLSAMLVVMKQQKKLQDEIDAGIDTTTQTKIN
jgi:thiol-disulfide isomerase/thioredoxin